MEPENEEEKENKAVKKTLRLTKPPRNMKAGLIGLTNIGKTSIFNLLTKSQAAVDESCYCTIDPNYASVIFYDKRVETIAKLIGSSKCNHPYVSILDTAGLVRNAHEDAGLGNDFLTLHQSLDILIHVVRGFRNDEITHVEGSIDPLRDILVVTNELLAKDIEIVTFALTTMEFTVNKGSCGREILYEYETLCKAYQVLTGVEYIPKKGGPAYLRGGGSVGSKSVKSKESSNTSRSTRSEKKTATGRSSPGSEGNPPHPSTEAGVEGKEEGVGEEGEEEEEEKEIRGKGSPPLISLMSFSRAIGRPLRYHDWDKSQKLVLMKYQFLSAKEMVYLLNISSRDYLRYTLRSLTWIDELLTAVTEYFTDHSSPTAPLPNIRFIVMSVEFEESHLQESLQIETFENYLQSNPFHKSALGNIFQSLYLQLDLIPFYTANATETKVYFIPQGTMAPEAGGHVDSEIEKKFICANVMSFDDLVEFENEFTLRRMGKLIQQGRKYIVNEGDIISFQHAK